MTPRFMCSVYTHDKNQTGFHYRKGKHFIVTKGSERKPKDRKKGHNERNNK